MANSCNSNDSPIFAGTSLANCDFLADDIKACQAKCKIVTLSLGGATGGAVFTGDAQAEQFAQTVWNLFFAGSSTTRPFGDAVLDGVDLDIEGGGSTGWIAFVNKFRSLGSGGTKKYYVTAAPQCPYPDAYLQTVLNGASFDAVYVQWYNNYCALPNYGTSSWNYADWHTWATTVSPNKNVKIFIGAPASSTAATSGYVSASQLVTIAQETKAQYSSFGGVMLWDASQAYANGRFDQTIKAGLGGSNGGGTTSTTITTISTTSTTTSTTSTTSGSCSAAPWSATTTYVGGQYATYGGSLWQASWWTLGDTPGGSAGVWKKLQTCKTPSTTSAAAPSASPVPSALPEGTDKSGVAPIKVPRPGTTLTSVGAAAEPTAAPSRRNSRVFAKVQ